MSEKCEHSSFHFLSTIKKGPRSIGGRPGTKYEQLATERLAKYPY